MKLYWYKMIGFPLFVLLGGFAIDCSVSYESNLFGPLTMVYAVIVFWMARDPLMDWPHFLYRGLVTGTALALVCWLQRWPLQIMFIAAIYLTGPNYNEEKERLRRFWARLRNMPKGGNP